MLLLLYLVLPLLLSLDACELALCGSGLISYVSIQWYIHNIISEVSGILLHLLLIDLYGTSPIEEVLLVLQKQGIKVLLLLDKFLLGRGRLELMLAYLQGHLLCVSIWWLL